MAEEKAKKAKTAKPAAPRAAKKAAAPADKKPAAARGKSDKKVKVTQIGSPIGRPEDQLATLKGLGLNRLRRSRVLEDTPAVRGMIARVHHLLRVESAS